MAERERCSGSGNRPRRTTQHKRIGNTPIAVRGECWKCGKDVALTSTGLIYTHKEKTDG